MTKAEALRLLEEHLNDAEVALETKGPGQKDLARASINGARSLLDDRGE